MSHNVSKNRNNETFTSFIFIDSPTTTFLPKTTNESYPYRPLCGNSVTIKLEKKHHPLVKENLRKFSPWACVGSYVRLLYAPYVTVRTRNTLDKCCHLLVDRRKCFNTLFYNLGNTVWKFILRSFYFYEM